MQFKNAFIAALASTAMATTTDTTTGSANGIKTFAVRVGLDATGKNIFKFFPENIVAPVGSVVQFQFLAGNHTVTQSTFDSPCVPISDTGASGFHSGFVPVAASLAKGEIPVYSITINDTKPIWLYCGQGKHCQSGMSMVINENTAANSSRSLSAYQNAAANVETAKVPSDGKVSGGTPGLAPVPSGVASSTGVGSAGPTGTVNATKPIATAAAAPKLAVPGLLAAAVLLL